MSARRVLVLVDDESLRASLVLALEAIGVKAWSHRASILPESPSAPAAEPDQQRVVLLAGETAERTLRTLSELRADASFASVPILLVVPDEQIAEVLPEAFELGADDLLRLPFSPAELFARVGARYRQRGQVGALALDKRDAEVMLELTQALTSSLDFREILYTVVRRIADFVHVARVSIVLAPEAEEDDVGFVVVASDDEQITNLRLELSKYPEIREVLRTREPLTITDARTHAVLDGVREDVESIGFSAMNLFPIVWEQQAIGVLFLRARPERGSLSEREASLCRVIASTTAVALRNARVLQSLRDHTQQITFARFEAERRLRELKRYADLFASAAEGIALVDASGRLRFANPRAYEISGSQVTADDDPERALEGVRLLDRVHPDDRPHMAQIWQGFARGEFPRGVDLKLLRDDGAAVICSCSFAPLADGEGAVLVSLQDVTEQRRTEAEFVKTMEFLESLIDASVDGIVASDMRGAVLLFNPGAERIYGWRADEVIGKKRVWELYPGDGAREIMRMIRSDAHGGVGRLSPTHLEARGRHGSIPIRLSAAMIYERGEPVATFGIFTDMREKLRVEERLAEAQQKLASTERQALIAELAGTAAHELNQPLTSVMAYAELLKRRLAPGSPEHRAADTMVREAERMADIVKKIGKMTKYETKSYVGRQRILDLDRASGERTSDPAEPAKRGEAHGEQVEEEE